MAQSPFGTAKFVKAFIGWWLIWASMHAGLLYWLGIRFHVAVTDSLITNFFIAGACFLVGYVMQFYLPKQERYWYIFAFSIFLSPVAVMISKWILVCCFGADVAYLHLLGYSLPVRFSFAFLLIACMSMLCVLWYGFQEQQETEQRIQDAASLSKEAELIALRRQLQPHFLFNSLNSISALVGTRPEEARNMIQQLSDFLRSTIRKDDNVMVTLQEELHHLQLYLDIEKVRFGHRLQTAIQTAGDAPGARLPALILQPIVENAIKFGLYDTTDAVRISITATIAAGMLQVEVENPYDPGTTAAFKGAGFGLESVRRRVYLLFGRQDLVTTIRGEQSFTTIIKIPQAA